MAAAALEIYIELADILLELEAALREQGLWQPNAPRPEALASEMPFCVDTLSLPQWLQFVFIARIKVLIEQRLPLPQTSAILPMAEEYFKSDPQPRILRALDDFDRLIAAF